MDQKGGITTVVDQQITTISARHGHHLLSAPPVLCEGLTLPCKDCCCASLRNGSSGMVLSAEDVAGAPSDLGTHGSESLNEDTCLDGHVEGAIDVEALERCSCTELLAAVHETWHLVLSQSQLLAAKLGKTHVLDLGLCHGSRCDFTDTSYCL